jgi:hypothetical protein
VSLDEIKAKRDLYLSLQKEHQDQNGWLDHSCDGLLFNSLNAYAGQDTNIYAARESSGRWRRIPDFERCKPFNGSKATISKDMFRGLLLYLWQKKDLDALKQIDQYGSDNNWIMGEAEDDESYYGRVVFWSMVPQIKDMLKLVNPSLTGIVLSNADEFGYVILKTSFAAHLHVLNIYLRAQMYGGITDYEKAVLSEYRKSQPRNALFAAVHAKYTDGNFQHSIDVLSDSRLFPKDRLPDSSGRCSDYIFQWEAESDGNWHPCDQGKIHSGIDLTFTVKVMED